MMLLGPPDGYRIGECTGWVFGGIGGQMDAQRCQNQGCWLMHMEPPGLKDEICC